MKKLFFTLFVVLVAVLSVLGQTVTCTSSATLDVAIEECIGTKDVSLLTNFVVSPNPNGGRFVVELASGQAGNVRITVADAGGRTILEQYALLQGSLTLPLSLENAPMGAYWVSVLHAGRIATRQVQIKK